MMRKLFLILSLFAVAKIGFGQEILSGIQVNESVRQKAAAIAADDKNGINLKRGVQENAPLQLPFFDDFTTTNVYPNEANWLYGKSVFVNKDFPEFPPTQNAATFDALNSVGEVYAYASWIPFMADVLTSQPIRLDSVFSPVVKALGPQDSVYLSFFYQPQGNGNQPEPWDTLILEFARRTGDTIYAGMDSITVSTQYYLDSPSDTLRPFDTLWAIASEGCNPEIYTINYATLGWDDFVTVSCDSIYIPEIIWEKKWLAEGMSLDSFYKANNNRYFKQVMIPVYDSINDTVFFTDNFQFRFRNYASISNDIIPSWQSNADQWNIDYVYLNYNRSADDTTYQTLAFTQRAPSFLKDFQAMPYNQYKINPVSSMAESFDVYLSNLDEVAHNSSYRYKIQQVNGNFFYQWIDGNFNVYPGIPAEHYEDTRTSFNIDYNLDTTSYLITHFIQDTSEAVSLIDSITYRQGFYNYFAYDDGTPEFGYGLEPAGALLAYQFNLSTPDTLFGVQMYFNHTVSDGNVNFFNLLVWKDNNGRPGEIIYSMNSLEPKWEDGLYEFYPYMFDDPFLMPAGTFYVGWQQQSFGSLNIGFDANQNNQYKIFYNNEQTWYPSSFQGSLLMRPIVGSNLILGTKENSKDATSNQLRIIPNPANSYFEIDFSNMKINPEGNLIIYSMVGTQVLEISGAVNRIDISHLPKGLYLVRFKNNEKLFTGKLIVGH